MAKYNMFSDEDVKILQAMINEQKKGIKGHGATVPSIGDFEEAQNTPDVYIALPPEDGIPALTLAGDVPGEGDIPGSGECEIYRLVHTPPDDPYLENPGIGKKVVYNLSTEEIASDTSWIVVHRTKQGNWIVPKPGGGGSGPAHILFVILRVLRGAGLNCNAMECEVLNVSCGGESAASIGDIVTVYDEMGCVFNAPEHLLIDRRGYAKQMSNPLYRIQDPLVFEPGTEDIAAPTGRCRWAADSLCCVEERI